MLKKNPEGNLECQETLEKIQDTLNLYNKQIEVQSQRESPSFFQKLTRKLKMKGQSPMSKKELIAQYLDEVKKDLIKNLHSDHISEMSTSCSGDDIPAGEAQDLYESDEEVDDAIIEKIIGDIHK